MHQPTLDMIVPPQVRFNLADRTAMALAAAGLSADIDIVLDQPVELASADRYRILGSLDGAHVPAIGIILEPKPRRAATAAAWSRQAAGEDIVRRVADQLVPAHVAVRVLYRVRHQHGTWRPVDPPRLGRARLGHIFLKGGLRLSKKTSTADALLTETLADLQELFGVRIDPDADPGAWDSFVRRYHERHRIRYHNGEILGEDLVRDLVNGQEALVRLYNEMASNLRIGRRSSRLQPSDIPLTDDPKEM